MKQKLELNELVQNLPDEEGWRLIDIPAIAYEHSSYRLILVFQRVENARGLYVDGSEKALRELSGFKVRKDDKAYLRVNISYSRIFTVGSIWWKNSSPTFILPDYFGSYIFQESFLKSARLIQSRVGDYLKPWNVPIDRIVRGSVQSRYADGLVYEFDRPLYHHKRGKNRFLKRKKSRAYSKFVVFYSFEVYRFFLTGMSIDTFNERTMHTALHNFQLRENKIFDIPQDYPSMEIEEGELPVILREASDFKNVEVIGNLCYSQQFRQQITYLQDAVKNRKDYTFSALKSLPIDDFSEMRVTAKRVYRSSDDEPGLLIMRIRTIILTEPICYRPFIPVPDSDIEAPPSGASGTKGGTVTAINEDGVDYDDTNTSDNGPNILLEQDNFVDELMNPNPMAEVLGAKEIKKPSVVTEGFHNFPGNSTSNPPGQFGNGGNRIKYDHNIPSTTYFSLFTDIIATIKEKIQVHYPCELGYLNKDLHFQPSVSCLNYNDLSFKTWIRDGKLLLYVVRIIISGRYFYILEQYFEKNGKTKNKGRTWLYSESGFRPLSEARLIRFIDEGRKKRNSNRRRREPDLKFNHGQKRLDRQIERKEAIVSHSDKISNDILKALTD